ncbi:MAG: flagellar basal body rod C-terminal domain-containing protein, partial [bacterium]
STPLTIQDTGGGNLADAFYLQTRVDSLAPANNGIAPTDNPIPLGSALGAAAIFYRTAAANAGSVTINGVSVPWNAGQDMATILGNMNAALGVAGVPLTANFDPATQKFYFLGNQAVVGAPRVPVSLTDASGNLGFVANLEAQPAFGGFTDTLLAQFQAQLDGGKALADQSDAAVAQLDLQRDAVSKVDIEEEKGRLLEFMRAYEAAVKAIAAMDEVLNTLINRMAASSFAGGSTTSVISS